MFGNKKGSTLVAIIGSIALLIILVYRTVWMGQTAKKSYRIRSAFRQPFIFNGIALSNTVLGGLAVEGNLLEALRKAEFEPNFTYDGV